ncbi:MAG: sugar transferase [Muribaculaceae bacterium]|nr:sugar transferase [Muribaculaceae bacterium]
MHPSKKLLTKRIFDIVGSLGGMIVLSPLFLGISILLSIKEPHSPIFFRQKRVGRFGKPFYIIKFSTMRREEGNKQAVNNITISNDERFTPTGAILNKYKLNELPQLWNVLKGEMSFVGPRPDVEGYADKLTGEDRNILLLKPGITGPATLKYRNEEELLAQQDEPLKYNDEVIWPDKVKINLKYFNEQSFLGDLKIIIKTIIG